MTEEDHYEAVVNELSSAPKQPALWAKALALCLGDEEEAHQCYIKLRVDQRMEEEKRALQTNAQRIKSITATLERSWPACLQILSSLAFVALASWYRASNRDDGSPAEAVLKGIVQLVVIGAIWMGCLWLLLKLRAKSAVFPWHTYRVVLLTLAALQAVVIVIYPAQNSRPAGVVGPSTPLPSTSTENSVASSTSSTPRPSSPFVPLDTTRPYPALSGLAAIKDLSAEDLHDWISKQRVIVSELEQSVTARNKTLLDQRAALKSKEETEAFNEEVRAFESDRERLLAEQRYLEQMESKLKLLTP